MENAGGVWSRRDILRWCVYVPLLAATVAGVQAVFHVLGDGHEDLNTTQHVPWGLWVACYIFFLGLSAGSFLVAALAHVFGVKRLAPVAPMALFQALVCLALGGALIVLDLGHPTRLFQIFLSFNYTSAMAWMGLLYNLYVIVILAALYLSIRPELARLAAGPRWSGFYRLLALGSKDVSPEALARDRRWLKRLGVLGLPLAIAVLGGEGAIFAVAKARPNWFGGLFPAILVVSALASGGALLGLVTAVFSKQAPEDKTETVRFLSRLTLGFLILDALLLFSELSVTLYGDQTHEVISWQVTLFGPLWWLFWIVQVAGGLLIPLLLIALPRASRCLFCLGAANLLIVIGIFATRVNVVIPPLLQPAFDTLPAAYVHPRFAYGYTPSATEWLVCLGVACLGAWALLLAERLLPLGGELWAENARSAPRAQTAP